MERRGRPVEPRLAAAPGGLACRAFFPSTRVQERENRFVDLGDPLPLRKVTRVRDQQQLRPRYELRHAPGVTLGDRLFVQAGGDQEGSRDPRQRLLGEFRLASPHGQDLAENASNASGVGEMRPYCAAERSTNS